MGTNHRYPGHGARLGEERELREARKRGPLQSLTDEQLGLRSTVVSVVPDDLRMWGLAWLRFGDHDVRATVRVWRWTADAVGVEVEMPDTEERLLCWVWRGAVERLARREDAWT